MEPKQTSVAPRDHALDALRAVMMLLGIVLHVSLPYNSWKPGMGWAFKDTQNTAVILDWVWDFIHSFRMPLFYLIAGYFAAMLLQKRGLMGLFEHRVRRIALPFLAGLVFLYPLTIWSSVYSYHVFKGSEHPMARAWSVLTSEKLYPLKHLLGEIRLRGVSVVGPGGHLWFLYYLFFFAVLAMGLTVVFRQRPGWARALLRVFSAIIQKFWIGTLVFVLLYFGALVWMDSRGMPTPRVPMSWWIVADSETLKTFLVYFGFFAFGWIVFFSKTLVHLRRYPLWQCGVGLAINIAVFRFHWPAQDMVLATFPGGGTWTLALSIQALKALSAVLLIFGLLAFFLRFFKAPSARLHFLMQASYWMYLVHIPLACFLPGLFGGIQAPPGVVFVIVLLLTTALSLLSYRYGVQNTFIGVFLQGRKK